MIDVTDATFETDVLEESNKRPVVIDLWAEWCGPCRTLGPIIEKVIDETGGRVLLAKVDVDANPQISQAFRVQSIPAVYALVDGQVVDGFMGAQPEEQIREFVARLLPSEDDLALEALLEAGDEDSLRQILESQPGHEDAIVALAELLVESGRSAEALDLLARIPETERTRPIAARARTGAEGEASKQAEIETRLTELLPTVKGDDDARQEFVDLLDVLGAEHPATAGWRKKLTAQLY